MIRAYAWSTDDPERARVFATGVHCAAVQHELSVLHDAPEWLAYFRDGRPTPEWLARLDAIREILASEGRSPAAGALAWILGRSDRTIPVPGFRTVAQVEQNVGAAAFGPLRADQIDEIDRLLGRR